MLNAEVKGSIIVRTPTHIWSIASRGPQLRYSIYRNIKQSISIY